MNIDRKFRILAVNPCKVDHVYTEKEGIFLCAHDLALIPALKAYLRACIDLNCNREHVDSIDLLIDRVTDYQNNVRNKIPSTDTDCEIDRCIGGVGV